MTHDELSQRVLARYLTSAVGPLTLDRTRVTRWIEHVTHRKVQSVVISLSEKPGCVLVVAGFADGAPPSEVQYEVEFILSTPTLDSIAMTPKIRAVRALGPKH